MVQYFSSSKCRPTGISKHGKRIHYLTLGLLYRWRNLTIRHDDLLGNDTIILIPLGTRRCRVNDVDSTSQQRRVPSGMCHW